MTLNGLSLMAAAIVLSCAPVAAQDQAVNRTAAGQPGTDIRVGVYVNVRLIVPSDRLPSIQLTAPPENGKVTVKEGKVTATNYNNAYSRSGSQLVTRRPPRCQTVLWDEYVWTNWHRKMRALGSSASAIADHPGNPGRS